jgi:hypothetical protein
MHSPEPRAFPDRRHFSEPRALASVSEDEV